MADNNLSAPAEPDVTTPQTYDEQVEDLSNLLGDPETDLPDDDQDEAAAATPEAEEDDPLGLDVEAEDVDETDADDPDGSEPEIKGGRFAPDTAKVTLDDGTVITVAELKRNNLYQRGFTEKTTALAKERETFEAERQSVTEYAQSLDQSREYLAWYAEKHLPKDPGPFTGDSIHDPASYIHWSAERDKWALHQQAYQVFQQQKAEEQQRQNGETQKQAETRLMREREALLKAMPVLKDPVKGKVAWDTMVSGAAEHYGITPDMVNTIGDHRLLVVLREALAYRRLKASAPQVRQQVAQRPVKPGRRAAPTVTAQRERQGRTERLRSTGSFEDGVVALQDFDL